MVSTAPQASRATSGSEVSLLVLVSTALLAIGSVLYLGVLAGMAFPATMESMLSFGRLRPAALSATMLGGLVVGFSAGAYYVLPRLTGAPLASPELARAGGLATAALSVVGVVTSLFGIADGVEPLGFPWWLDLPVLVTLTIPLVVTVRTVAARTEKGVYPTLWFVMGGTLWLPLLYLAANIPGLNPIAQALQGATFTAGFGTLWVTVMGVGLAYYTVVKASEEPLASRQLAQVGFWSLAFAAIWAGPVQLVFGPTPDWLDALAAVFTLALPVAALANSYAIAATLGRAWEDLGTRPSLLATLAGMGMTILVGAATAVASFRSAASLVALTTYWEGVLVATLFGVGSLLSAGWIHQGLRAVLGLRPPDDAPAIRHVKLTAWGTTSTAVLLMLAGVVTGVGWTANAYAQNPAVGEAWAVSTVGRTLVGLAVLTGVVMVAGQLSLLVSVYRTVTAGLGDTREVLVPTGDRQGGADE